MPFEGNGTFNQISIKVTLQRIYNPITAMGSFRLDNTNDLSIGSTETKYIKLNTKT